MKHNKSSGFKTFGFILYDVLIVSLSYMFAWLSGEFIYKINFNYEHLVPATIIVSLFTALIFYIAKVYKAVLKHTGFFEVLRMAFLIVVINLLVVIALWLLPVPKFIPKREFFFVTAFQLLFILSSRITVRIKSMIDNLYALRNNSVRYLIIGAGVAGRIVLEEVQRQKYNAGYVVGFLDDDHELKDSYISGVKILGQVKDLEAIVKKHRITDVILAIKEYPLSKAKELYELVSELQLGMKKLNLIDSLEKGSKPKLNHIKIEDLLERKAIKHNLEEISKTITGKVVLVTGGGGSIGSELCRQIFKYKPKQLIIFDIYENNAYDIQMELKAIKDHKPEYDGTEVTVLIGSVYNKTRLESVFKQYKPQMVYHAAACKHVPLMEDSPMEAIRTNVIGTYYCASLASKYEVEKFVLVSTDKAVRPTNVMGATKRFAELIIKSINKNSNTIYTAVRFGNVLGSNGSVVPLFKKQIENGGPITITHPDITRYFMTIPEAVGLILQCSYYAKNDETFVLDMGHPVKIYDLAKKMIRLSGYRLDVDLEIKIIGLRPGEKMYEELLVDPSKGDHITTANTSIFVEKDSDNNINLDNINDVIDAIDTLSVSDAVVLLERHIDTYKRVDSDLLGGV